MRSYELLHLQTGHRVLDAGCGPGTDTVSLARMMGPSGQVVGIDTDKEMIVLANNRAEEAGVADRVLHEHCDAISLPSGSDYFNACRSERLFQHILNPRKVLSEMVSPPISRCDRLL